MKSIAKRFEAMEHEFPNLSTYICFVRAITGQGFSRGRILRAFKKLVDKDDYAADEFERWLLPHLMEMTNTPVASSWRVRSAPKRTKGKKVTHISPTTKVERSGASSHQFVVFWPYRTFSEFAQA